MQCCGLSFMLMESFSSIQGFEISFEIRFTTFNQNKMPKYLENKSLWLLPNLVTLLNLVYLVPIQF